MRDGDSLLSLLQRTVHVALKCIEGLRWCSITLQLDGAPITAASTDQLALRIDEQQYRTEDAPCLRAIRTERVVATTDEDVTGLWPILGEVAEALGPVRSSLPRCPA